MVLRNFSNVHIARAHGRPQTVRAVWAWMLGPKSFAKQIILPRIWIKTDRYGHRPTLAWTKPNLARCRLHLVGVANARHASVFRLIVATRPPKAFRSCFAGRTRSPQATSDEVANASSPRLPCAVAENAPVSACRGSVARPVSAIVCRGDARARARRNPRARRDRLAHRRQPWRRMRAGGLGAGGGGAGEG